MLTIFVQCRPLTDAVCLVLHAMLFPGNTRTWNTLTRILNATMNAHFYNHFLGRADWLHDCDICNGQDIIGYAMVETTLKIRSNPLADSQSLHHYQDTTQAGLHRNQHTTEQYESKVHNSSHNTFLIQNHGFIFRYHDWCQNLTAKDKAIYLKCHNNHNEPFSWVFQILKVNFRKKIIPHQIWTQVL